MPKVAEIWSPRVHRHELIVIEFLQAENRVLKDRLRGKRIRFTDAERALLGRKALSRRTPKAVSAIRAQYRTFDPAQTQNIAAFAAAAPLV